MDLPPAVLLENGMAAAFALADGPMTLQQSMDSCDTLLRDRIQMVLQLLA